ncbi:MAG: hypothetical protein ABIJ96_03285 [Elusimicrobiota bacterium]
MSRRGLKERLLDLFSDEDDPEEPYFDPAHIGAVIILCLTGIGALYWLLWTLLVFEGGLFGKLGAAAAVLFTSKTLKDVGYLGTPHAMGPFEGWLGNVLALALCVLVAAALKRLYTQTAAKNRRRP